jgi:hypothetical protein
MYYNGNGVKLDYAEAANWVQRAANQGDPRAQLDLAYLYERGKGVKLDYVSAYAWYTAAQAGGEKRANARRKSLSQLMTKEQISTASTRADELPRSPFPSQGAESSNTAGATFLEH